MDAQTYENYVNILEKELVPALGCTEPIAVAYAGAVAAEALGRFPERIFVASSGNIIKNVKGVIVPNSGGQKGIEAAAVLGALAGDPARKLEVLSGVTPADVEKTRELVRAGLCSVDMLPGVENLHIIVTVEAGADGVTVEIAEEHTNIVSIMKNGEYLQGGPYSAQPTGDVYTGFMSLDGIIEFAENCDLADVRAVLDRQIECNSRIADEGLAHDYGAAVGRTLLRHYGSDVRNRAKARAAAGSDARMDGCELPVVINSGSGNQGMTVSLPVIEYAKELGASQDELYRALVISNLVSIHLKSGIGKLSAFCGAVSAACGSGAAITYLNGGSRKQIEGTITNTVANVSGMVCDGAKASCAAKIASSVDAAIMAHIMAMDGQVFAPGDGIVMNSPEDTIHSVGRMARLGMRQTDEEVIRIMIGK